MLSINMDDVMQVVSNIQNYLIAFGVVLVLALLVMFAVRKMPKAKKKMIRAQSGLAILLALALVKKLYTRTYLRTIFYIPAVLSYVVVGIMFTAMFQMNGTFNQILNAFGIPCTKEWLASGDTALLMVIVEDVWKWTGFHMIIYIAGLQAIPTDLYEAAKIDGASAVRSFFSVTLPLLIPSLTINVTQAIIGGFRVFEQVLTLTDGGPGHQSTVVSMMVYEYFGRGFYGKSTAISMMLSVIVLFVTLAVRGYFNKKAVSY